MPEYIERDEAVRKALEACVKVVGHGISQIDAVDIAEAIDDIPAADVAEVRWKAVDGYDGLYEVSTLGQVRNAKGLVMKQHLKRDKYTVYKKVALWKDGKYKQFYVHRLVAEAFVENPNNLPIVNHKDEDGTNNLPNNLEWCNKSYNAKYGKSPEKIGHKNIPPPNFCKSPPIAYKVPLKKSTILLA